LSSFRFWLAAGVAAAPACAYAQAAPVAPPPAKADEPAASTTVKGVTVTGDAHGFRSSIDRRSYDISRDLATAGGSIADALRNVPSVSVDVNGNVSLRGDGNVTILIDGKPSNQFKGPGGGQALLAYPADQIERVEVITNPSAAYSAEGTGGIINLVTRKVRKAGRSGSVRGALGGAGRRNGGASFAWNRDALSVSADAGFRHDPQHSITADESTAIDPVSGAEQTTRRFYSLKGPLDQWNARAGVDYDLDAKTRLGGELRRNMVTFDTASNEPLLVIDEDGAPVRSLRQEIVTRQNRVVTAGSAGFRRSFGDDHELTANLSRETNRLEQDDRRTNVFTVPAGPDAYEDILQRTDLGQTEAKVDYSRPLPAEAKLKLGWDLRLTDNRYDVASLHGTSSADAVPDPDNSDLFRYRQTLNAAYATLERPFGKLTVLAGLRLEDERLQLEQPTGTFRRTRDDLRAFPSLHLAWKLSDTQQLTAAYSERIQRPSAGDLNPFRFRQGASASEGDPDLEPQLTRSFEAGWQRKQGGGYYLATLYYRRNEHGVTDVLSDLGDGVLLTTRANLASSRNAGLELVTNRKFGTKLSVNLSSNLYWTEIDAANLGLAGIAPRRSGIAAGGKGSVSWQATPKDLFQINGSVTPKRLLPQGYVEPMPLIFLGYRHKVGEALSWVVTVQDAIDHYRYVQVLDTPTLREHSVDRGRLQSAYLGLTWSFGAATKKAQGFDFGT
jgi:outer membrane receptor protein involved in Fe transport